MKCLTKQFVVTEEIEVVAYVFPPMQDGHQTIRYDTKLKNGCILHAELQPYLSVMQQAFEWAESVKEYSQFIGELK